MFMFLKKFFLLFCFFIVIMIAFIYSSDFNVLNALTPTEILNKIDSTIKLEPNTKKDFVIKYSSKIDIKKSEIKKKFNICNDKIRSYLSFLVNGSKLLNVKFLDSTYVAVEDSSSEYLEILFVSDFLYTEDIKKNIEILTKNIEENFSWCSVDQNAKKYKIKLNDLLKFNNNKTDLTDAGKDVLKYIVNFINEFLFDYDLKIKLNFYFYPTYDFDTVYEQLAKKLLKDLNSKLPVSRNFNLYVLIVPKNVEELSLIIFNEHNEINEILQKISLDEKFLYIRKKENKSFVKINNRGDIFKKTLQDIEKLPKKYVYFNGDNEIVSFYPTGWIGDVMDVSVDFSYRYSEEEKCINIFYKPTNSGYKGWFGLVWQYPPNNWGNRGEKGLDLTGYKKLVFYAKGEKGGETIAELKVGGIDAIGGDTDLAWIGHLKLTNNWTRYEIDLKKKNLSNIISGFVLVLTKRDAYNGLNIYLSNIYYE